MKNKPYKPLKSPKNKQKAIALALGSALALCSIIAPFTAYTVNADVVDEDKYLENYIFNDYYRHPLGGFSLSCCDIELGSVEVFDCPATYGGNATYFSNRDDFTSYTAWQNTTNGTFRVYSSAQQVISADDTVFQFVGFNTALVREHIDTIGWVVGTGAFEYDIDVFAYPVLSAGADYPDIIHYRFSPSYWNDGQYKFYWADIFTDMPDFVFSNDGTALFDAIWISFVMSDDFVGIPVVAFTDEGDNTDILQSDYALRVNRLFNWVYNGSPIETILSFPIDFLKTEIFPDFSFGMLLLIALGVILFGFALKIAFGG